MAKTKNLISREYIYEHYINQQKSFIQISEETGINHATIRYHALRMGIPIRSRSDAQKLSQENGRAFNPTEGKSLSPAHRASIAKATSEHWKNLPPEEKEIRRQKSLEYAKNNPDKVEKFFKAGQKAQKRVSKEGSNVEAFLLEELSQLGYWVEPHKKHAIQSENMHIDLMLKKEMIAIEVDGPTHLRPIYGQEDFDRKREKDQRKNGLLLQDGYSVIRIGVERARSLSAKTLILEELLKAIEEVKREPNKIVYCGKYN
jgi:very-short-patch-repair endonuclease/DNA-binding CsgD family transcriptional regulator